MPAHIMQDSARHTSRRLTTMYDISAWDDPDTERPDTPTELEMIREQYPGIDPDEYTSFGNVELALWEKYGKERIDHYTSMFWQDPAHAADQDLYRAATVLWANRSEKE